MISEAFTNVGKHADASRVDVRITAGETLRCEVRDDGRGFDDSLVDSALSRGSLGLHVARERVDSAGGHLYLHSAPGGGTILSFALPLRRTEAHDQALELVTA